MSVRSMTGFARVRKTSEAGEVVLSLKSVNHRGLDLHFHMPPELDALENVLRALIKQRAARGHFQVHVSFSRNREAVPAFVNHAMLAAYVSAFRQAAADLGLAGDPDLNAALTIPGVFREPPGEEPEAAIEQLLVSVMEEALSSLNSFREREGAEIAADLKVRAATIRDLADRMREIRERALPAFHARLVERLAELLQSPAIEPQRLVQEAALLADRSDICEEVARLKTHTAQVEALLSQGGEIGKKMEFLLQEMNRETNTILSKTGGVGELGLGITELALAARADIERIREQSLNLE
jgi:uncharacterized protein (TIGR00255 family)